MNIFQNDIPRIQDQMNGDKSQLFGLGLWLDAISVNELHNTEKLTEFKKYLDKSNYYAFTVNAFPYGSFHGSSVKSNVYSPDWTTDERRDYTCKVADILAELIPAGITGSISTVPGSYKEWITQAEQLDAIATNILQTAQHLKELHQRTGKKILLSIEMEPDCLWESPDEFIDFYQKYLSANKQLKEYIGVCYDTCHQEFVLGNPGDGLRKFRNANIVISKIQLSAALGAPTPESKELLADNFSEEVYLHQTREFNSETMVKYPDLPNALATGNRSNPWVIHFHIPVYLTELFGGLNTAKSELEAVLEIIQEHPEICSNLEIETYTYAVLPEVIKAESLEASIAREYQWVIDRIQN